MNKGKSLAKTQRRVDDFLDLIAKVLNPLTYSLFSKKHVDKYNQLDSFKDVFDVPDNIENKENKGVTGIALAYSPIVVDKLLKGGIDVNRLTASGHSQLCHKLLYTLNSQYDFDSMRLIATHTYPDSSHPDIHQLNEDGSSIIHFITHSEMYHILISSAFSSQEEKRAYLNSVRKDGNGVLHIIVHNVFCMNLIRKQELQNIKEMILSYEMPDVINDKKKSDILLSLYNKQFQTLMDTPSFSPSYIELLCKEGIDVSILNHAGVSALDMCINMLDYIPPCEYSLSYMTPYLPLLRDIIHILIRYGANLYDRSRGKSPLDVLLSAHKRAKDYRKSKASLPAKDVYHTLPDEYRLMLFSILDGLYTSLYASCRLCGATGKLKLCSGCELVHYCSPAHQKEDWKAHKSLCRAYPVSKKGGYRATRRARKHSKRAHTRRH